MALSSTTTRVSYDGDGTTSAFAIPFKFLENSHIEAILRAADGTETTWVEGTQYTLTGAEEDAGGTLTVSITPTDYRPVTGKKLVIRRAPPLTQPSALPLGGSFPSTTVEQMADLLTMESQLLQEQIDRTLKFPVTDSSTLSPVIPPSVVRAGKLLGFDDNAEPVVTDTTIAEFDTIVSDAIAAAQDASAAAAQAEALVSAAVTAANDALAAAHDAEAIAAALAGGVVVITFTGDGTVGPYALSVDPVQKSNTQVFIEGVYQDKATYSVTSTSITFTAAVPTGAVGEIEISALLPIGVPSNETVGAAQIKATDVAAIKTKLGVPDLSSLGDLATLDTVGTAQIDDAAVTFIKMQLAPSQCLVGASAGGNPFQQFAIGSGLSLNTGTGTLSATGVTNSAVGQAQLKTAFSEAAVLAGDEGSPNTTTFVGVGGEYAFAQVWKTTTTGFGGCTLAVALTSAGEADNSFAGRYSLSCEADKAHGADGVGTLRQRYISASPPYDAGEGPMSDFVFLKMRRGGSRTVEALWSAQDPPWAYNGPTRTRANAWRDEDGNIYFSVADASAAKTPVVPVIARRTRETLAQARASGRVADYLRELHEGDLWYEPVTPEMKMRDVTVIPHPFFGVDINTHVIVMLDPHDDVTRRLVHLMRHADEAGESITDLVFRGDVKIGNLGKTKRWSPPGVELVKAEIR